MQNLLRTNPTKFSVSFCKFWCRWWHWSTGWIEWWTDNSRCTRWCGYILPRFSCLETERIQDSSERHSILVLQHDVEHRNIVNLLKLLEDAQCPNYMLQKVLGWAYNAKLDGFDFNPTSQHPVDVPSFGAFPTGTPSGIVSKSWRSRQGSRHYLLWLCAGLVVVAARWVIDGNWESCHEQGFSNVDVLSKWQQSWGGKQRFMLQRAIPGICTREESAASSNYIVPWCWYCLRQQGAHWNLSSVVHNLSFYGESTSRCEGMATVGLCSGPQARALWSNE